MEQRGAPREAGGSRGEYRGSTEGVPSEQRGIYGTVQGAQQVGA